MLEGASCSAEGDLLKDFFAGLWRRNPVQASDNGIHDYDDELKDLSASAIGEEQAWLESSLCDLEAMDLGSLGDADAQDVKLAMAMIRTRLLQSRDLKMYAVNPVLYSGLCISGLYLLCARDYAPLEERLLSVVKRLSLVERVLGEARKNLSRPPGIWVDLARETTQATMGFIRRDLPPLFGEVPSLKKDFERWSQAALRALAEHAGFLGEELAAGAPRSYAIGKDAFEFLLREEHMLDLDTQELLDFGQEWIAMSEEGLEGLAGSIEPGSNWKEVDRKYKNDHPSPAELVDFYRSRIEDARRFVLEKDLVSLPEKERLDVVPTPEFERVFLPYAAYMPAAPFEKEQRGFFFVTPVDETAGNALAEQQLRGHNRYKAVVTALHEAYPGHHLQTTVSNSNPSVVRKLYMSDLLVEGWALYCEEMMFEQGFYPDTVTRFYQLKDTLWRACRVVLDVKLHLGLFSFEEAVRFLVDRAGLEELNAQREVNRYTLSPTQPMSYLVGREQIMRLRQQVRDLRGEEFRLKRFHDWLLSHGSVPPGLISADSFFS